MNSDLISRDTLKDEVLNICKTYTEMSANQLGYDILRIIDNAPTIVAENATSERPQGEWIRKEDVIHSIAKQYSEHNELVPIWLSIGDVKGDRE